jgi:4'-phosphopantetheinyl transferase
VRAFEDVSANVTVCARLEAARTVVYLVDVTDSEAHGGAESLLAPGERRRAASFRLAERAQQFVVCRASARALLGAELGIDPPRVPIEEGSCGRPAVAAWTGWDFNISHSRGVGLVALRSCGRVGVDVQQAKTGYPWSRVMRSICRRVELEELAREASEIGDVAYLERWVAKEALLKMLGTGFNRDPRIELRPDDRGRLRAVGPGVERAEIVALPAPAGFAAALAYVPSPVAGGCAPPPVTC